MITEVLCVAIACLVQAPPVRPPAHVHPQPAPRGAASDVAPHAGQDVAPHVGRDVAPHAGQDVAPHADQGVVAPHVGLDVTPEAKPEVSVEDEVLANLRGLELGPVTVADLDLPEDFLRRVSDRIIRSSFEDRYRIVIADPQPGEGGQMPVLAPPPEAGAGYATSGATVLLLIAVIAGGALLLVAWLALRRRKVAA